MVRYLPTYYIFIRNQIFKVPLKDVCFLSLSPIVKRPVRLGFCLTISYDIYEKGTRFLL